MLRIPVAGERLPPLVVPLKSSSPKADEVSAPQEKGEKRRRRKKSKASGDNGWDSEPEVRRGSHSQERRQMFWMLAGGGTLFLLIVAGVVAAMMMQGEFVPRVVFEPVVSDLKADDASVSMPVVEKSDEVMLAEAEPVIREFLTATSVEAMVPLVRNPEVAGARMKGFHADGKIEAPGLGELGRSLRRTGPVMTVDVRTKTYEDRWISFEDTPEGIRIDWESWAGWSEMPWEEFLASKPVEAKLFRVKVSEVDYFNFSFADDEKWKSYRIESPGGEHMLFGYAERGTVMISRLRPPGESKEAFFTLLLGFPENANSGNQVIIAGVVAEGWVVEDEGAP